MNTRVSKLAFCFFYLIQYCQASTSIYVIQYDAKDWEKEKIVLCKALVDGSLREFGVGDKKYNESIEIIVKEKPEENSKEISRFDGAINDYEPISNNRVERVLDNKVSYLVVYDQKIDWAKIRLNKKTGGLVEPYYGWIKIDGDRAKLVSKRYLFEEIYLKKLDYFGIDLSKIGYKTYKNIDETSPSVNHNPFHFEDQKYFLNKKPLLQILDIKKNDATTFIKIGFKNKKQFYDYDTITFEGAIYEKNEALKKLDETWIKLDSSNHSKVIDLNHEASVSDKHMELFDKKNGDIDEED